MLIDASNLSDRDVLTEVCIVGGGPAGLTLARELSRDQISVCLLEGGGQSFNPETQSLYVGETIGDPFQELAATRERRLGGTSHAWHVQFRPSEIGVRYGTLDAIDLEQREGFAYSGWPITRDELEPFYQRARSVCQVDPHPPTLDWATENAPPLGLPGETFETTLFQFGPRAAFTHHYPQILARSPWVQIYLNANVVELETSETAQTVTRVRVATLAGTEFYVTARLFILATGGLETARLLLLSNQAQAAGLGNEYDQVGRFFMDHPLVKAGTFLPANPELFNRMALYDLRQVNGLPVMGKLSLTESALRTHQLLNSSFLFYPRPRTYSAPACKALNHLLASVKQRQFGAEQWQSLQTVMSGLGELIPALYYKARWGEALYPQLAQGGWSDLPHKDQLFTAFEVIQQTEQAPDPENRVVLGQECDRLGRRQIQLHWCWRDRDIDSARRIQELLATELQQAGLGELQLARDGDRPCFWSPGSHHHMGTTRMHLNPRQGVVDVNCKVHSVSNLFIASSSVFPTGGYINPTFTIVALALRLADHLKEIRAAQVITAIASELEEKEPQIATFSS